MFTLVGVIFLFVFVALSEEKLSKLRGDFRKISAIGGLWTTEKVSFAAMVRVSPHAICR